MIAMSAMLAMSDAWRNGIAIAVTSVVAARFVPGAILAWRDKRSARRIWALIQVKRAERQLELEDVVRANGPVASP